MKPKKTSVKATVPKKKYRTFNVCFSYYPGGGAEERINDETQFDIEDTGDFTGMFNELVSLFNDFIQENSDLTCAVISMIDEVPYDGAYDN